MRFYGKNVSFCVSTTTESIRNAKKIFEFFKICWLLGPFLKNQCFGKMGVAGIKWGQCSSTIPPFLMNLDVEALLKVSFKNIDWFQICPFSKTTAFSKKALKTNKFCKIQIFFCISGGNFIGLFNGILFVFILSVVVDTQKETFLP